MIFTLCCSILKITPYDEAPTTVCGNCFEFVTKIDAYAAKCQKTDRMYTELIYRSSTIQSVGENEENEVLGVRVRYGLDEEEVKLTDFTAQFKPHNDVLKIDQTTDTFDLNPEVSEIKEEKELIVEGGRKKSNNYPYLFFIITP